MPGTEPDLSRRQAVRDFSRAPLTVGILLWPSFPLMSLTGLVESLRHAADHGDGSHPRYARWEILGPNPGRVESSCGIMIETTAPYGHPGAFDYLIVIGGLLRDLANAPRPHREFIRATHRAGKPVVAVCTGSFILAQEGLLDGKPVCVHPYHKGDFEAAFPRHRIVLNKDYEMAGKVITVLGGVSILSLMTRIVGEHFGPERAAKVVHQMTLPASDRASWFGQTARPGDLEITDSRIQKALVMLDAEATQSPGIANLARTLGLSERHFLRLFRRQVGRSPKDYLLDTKLRAAVWMLQHTARSITSVAYAAGFASGASLADHCRKRLDASPTQIRRLARTVRTPSG